MDHIKQRLLHDAAWDGDMHAVLTLMADPAVDVAGQHSCALLHAAHRGHWRLVEWLLPLSDPMAHRSEALLRAATHGHGRCVTLLAPVSDPTVWYPHEWAGIRPALRARICRLAGVCAGWAAS